MVERTVGVRDGSVVYWNQVLAVVLFGLTVR